jgi:hypothetical protein
MNLTEAKEILKLHNEWRRGAEIEQQDPVDIGIAIDTILESLPVRTNKEENKMIQEVEQTHEEKLAMYMKLSKKELAEMLIESNRVMKIVAPIAVEPTLVKHERTKCDVCGCYPIVIYVTEKGTFCQQHAVYH